MKLFNKKDNLNNDNFKDDNSFNFVIDLKNKPNNNEKKNNFKEKNKEINNNEKVNLNGIFSIFHKIINSYVKVFAFLFWILVNALKYIGVLFLFLAGKRKINFSKCCRLLLKNKTDKIIDNKKEDKKILNERKKEEIIKRKRYKRRKNIIIPENFKRNFLNWPEKEIKNIHRILKKEGLIKGKINKNSYLLKEDGGGFNNSYDKKSGDWYDEKEYYKYDRKRKIKTVISFLVVILILVIPFQILNYYNLLDFKSIESKVLNNSKSAIDDLKIASKKAQKLELKSASDYFSQANENFSSAQEEISKIDKFVLTAASLSNNPKFKLASVSDKIVKIGVLGSDLGSNLGLALDSIFLATKTDINNENELEKKDFVDILDNFLFYGKRALNNSRELEIELNNIPDSVIPAEYLDDFKKIKEANTALLNGLDELINLAENLKPFLGVEKDKRYLLIFQNNTELRASGGFMGSFALMDVRRGAIRNLEVPKGGTYDTEAGLLDKIVAPEPLWLVNPLWHFWDCNWWPDWKKTAENIAWFYEKSDGPTVDGVISFTPTVLESMLEVLGPIDMSDEYGVIINSDNFWDLVQPIVEEKTVTIEDESGDEKEIKNTQPKKIIGDLMFKILDEIPKRLDSDKMFSLISTLDKNLHQKQILLYFTDEDLQYEIERYSWAGRIKESPFDYLSVINTNIAGQKTDRKIKQKIVLDSNVDEKGYIINDLTIYRYHTGEKWTEFTGVRNVNWLRVYVPLGSQLISAEGFDIPDEKYFEYPEEDWIKIDKLENERKAIIDKKTQTKIYEDSDKTVFANWTMVDPGQTDVIKIKYKLPFNFFTVSQNGNSEEAIKNIFSKTKNIFYPYSLVVQKQPGDLNTELEARLKIDVSGITNLWYYPYNSKIDNFGWEIFSDLDTDKYFGALWSEVVEK
ncbi:DUF4012 domain-containing protein [bacterium]|nr:DUF4012 domain-containing protein [bacterium]